MADLPPEPGWPRPLRAFGGRWGFGSGLVTHCGGNGMTFGMQVSGCRVAGSPPRHGPAGQRPKPLTLDDCTGAYGDSALAEGFGLGAMALPIAQT